LFYRLISALLPHVTYSWYEHPAFLFVITPWSLGASSSATLRLGHAYASVSCVGTTTGFKSSSRHAFAPLIWQNLSGKTASHVRTLGRGWEGASSRAVLPVYRHTTCHCLDKLQLRQPIGGSQVTFQRRGPNVCLLYRV